MKKVKPLKKSKTLLLKITLGVFFLFVLIITVSIGFSYTSYPNFFPSSLALFIDNTIASVSFLPKNNRQILVHSLSTTQELSSYRIAVDISLTNREGREVVFASLAGDIQKAESYGSSYLADFTFPNKDVKSATFAEEGDNFYAKFNETLILPGLIVPQGKRTWYQVDMKSIQTSLGLSTREDTQIVADVNKKILENKAKIIGIVNKNNSIKVEKIEGEDYYRLEIPMDKKLVKDLISPELEINQAKITIWVNRNNSFLKKLNLTGKIDLSNDPLNKGVNLSFTYLIKDYSVKQPVLPVKTTKIDSPVDLWLKLNVTDADNSAEALVNSAQYAKDFGQSFLTLERVIKVIFLLPKSL